MARSRKHRAKKRLPDPEEVLDGRVEIKVEVLFDLIHQVNPTGRRLPGKERAALYALKSRLQSLLIRRFGDEHLAVETTGHQNQVLLNHLSGARHACHTLLSTLDDDARAWVLREIERAASPEVEAPEPWMVERQEANDDRGEDALSLLESGLRAASDFDYETAAKDLRRAFEHSREPKAPCHLDAARALLELEVDVLGMDQRALELEPLLDAETRGKPRVRALLGLAAARLGDSEHALERVAGLAPSLTVAEVYAALASQALERRDRKTARGLLERLVEHDPAHAQLVRLRAELAELREQAQRAAEAELERQYRRSGAAAVEGDARALAERWPGSDIARRILRELAEARRRREIAQQLAAAEEALAEERLESAARYYQAALDVGCERPDLPALITEIEDRERRRRERQRVEAVRRQLAAVVPVAGGPGAAAARRALLDYLALPGHLRQSAGDAGAAADVVAWLEALAAPASGARAHAAVAAVLALRHGLHRLDDDPAEALKTLRPHREILESLDDGRRALEQSRTRLYARRRDQARAHLERARQAVDDDSPQARGLLGKLDLGSLDDDGRARVERLRADLERRDTVRRLEQEADRHLAADDPLGALERVHRLAEIADSGDARRRWRQTGEELDQRLRRAWRIEVADSSIALESPQGIFPSPVADQGVAALDDDGRRLVLANTWHGWLFVRVVDVDRRQVVARLSLKPPLALESPVAVCWNGDRVRLAGVAGGYLEIDPQGGEIFAWREIRDLLPRKHELCGMWPLPGAAPLWIVTRAPWRRPGGRGGGKNWRMYTVDLETGRLGRKLPAGRSWVLPILGSEPRVVFSGKDMPVKLYSAHGAPEPGGQVLSHSVLYGAVSPDGEGLLLAASSDDPSLRRPPAPVRAVEPGDRDGDGDDEEDADAWQKGIMLVHVEPAEGREHRRAGGAQAKHRSGIELPEAMRRGANAVAAALEQGLGFALVQYDDFRRELLAVEVVDGELRELYRVPVPYHTLLATDRRSRRVLALISGETALDVLPLGRRPPRISLPQVPEPDDWELPDLAGPFACWDYPDDPSLAGVSRSFDRFRITSAHKGRRILQGVVQDFGDDPNRMVYLFRNLRQQNLMPRVREPLIREQAAKYPGHTGFALLLAETAADDGRWQQVLDILSPIEIEPGDITDCYVMHYYHLLGLALLYTGDAEAAAAAFEQGLDHKPYGMCNMRPLIELTRPMPETPVPGDWSPDQPLVRQLVGAIRTADRALAAGDAGAARAALERPVLWRAVEVQSAARLAVAHLRTGESAVTAGDRFNRRLGLAFFLDAVGRESGDRREILLAGLSWDSERLEELEDRARAWLDAP